MLITKILTEYLRRVMRNYKIYAVSILGMAVAIIASFHIYHFVHKELSVDQFHKKGGDIYRLTQKHINSNITREKAYLRLGEVLKADLPEVVDYVRVVPGHQIILKQGSLELEDKFSYIDPSFFELFDFNLTQGSISGLEHTENGVVLSEKRAKALFGDKNPIGEALNIKTKYDKDFRPYQIVGIVEDIPATSTIQGEIFVNIKPLENYYTSYSKDNNMDWVGVGDHQPILYLYLPKLRNNTKILDHASDIIVSKFKASPYYPDYERHFELGLQPFKDIYFTSNNIPEQKKKGDLQFLKIIILVGILGLFLAIANYLVMSLGLNLNRVGEFKTKRFLGASKANVFQYLVVESLFNATLCFIITLITYPYISTLLSNAVGFEYALDMAKDHRIVAFYVGILFVISFVIAILEYAMSYKAIFVVELKQKKSWATKQVLVGFQLLLLLTLVLCIAFVNKQVNYIEGKDIGINLENVAAIATNQHDVELRDFLTAKSYVNHISYSGGLFSSIKEDVYELSHQGSDVNVSAVFKRGDNNCLDVFGLELMLGRNLLPKETLFATNAQTDKSSNKIVDALVNETFVRKSGLDNPIGETFTTEYGQGYTIVGVFKDVHTAPLYYPKEPLILSIDYFQWYIGLFQVAFNKNYEADLIKDVKAFYEEKNVPFYLVDSSIHITNLDDIYKKELQLKRLLEIFTIIVLFISLLGLVAISLFITGSRTKEIGIRKVNGATINQIMVMLNKDFIKWVVIAFVIAAPIAWLAMSKWLEGFAYKTSLSWWVFAMAGAFTLIITLLTASWQSVKAAKANPVKSLRTE